MAFVEFWMLYPGNSRSPHELQDAAETLLRGCVQHFRAGVTRVMRISAVVPPQRADAFQKRVLALLTADPTEFERRAEVVIRDFPLVKSWLSWWMRPSHAAMLFTSERRMEPAIWDSLPDSTNAEESMHWKLYSAVGRDLTFSEGILALYAVSKHYERMYEAVSSMYLLFRRTLHA